MQKKAYHQKVYKEGGVVEAITMLKERTVIGCREMVILKCRGGHRKSFIARVDTGAKTSSMDLNLSTELSNARIVKTKTIRSANGVNLRPIIEATIIIAGNEITSKFTLADRTHMKYKILIARNIIRKGKFLIDPLKPLKKTA